MFRFEEDAFLRKGGDYSRNCLSFEEEEELAARLADRIPSISIPASVPTARTVFISAGGKCTEPLVRSFAKEPSSWSSNSVGQYALVDGQLTAFICPSERRPAKDPLAAAVEQERSAAKYLVECCAKQETTLVILCTSPAREQPEDFDVRKLSNGFMNDASVRELNLETGRLVTSFAAAIMEQATLRSIPAICFIAPREAVLSRETLDVFAELIFTSPLFATVKDQALSQRRTWTSVAIKTDEKDMRRFEPEGMFM